MKKLLAALMIVLLAAPAVAQISVQEPAQPKAPPPKKHDDKDYKAAVGRMPDQKFDPWRNLR